MSSFDEPGANHRNALAQVDDARKRALTAVSELRQAPPPAHHPNLAPTNSDSGRSAVLCTQAVMDYLLHLRPYRAGSSTWDIDFGTVELPKTINDNTDDGGTFGRSEPKMWICRQPAVPLRTVSQLIEAANTTIQYSTNHPNRFDRRAGPKEPNIPDSDKRQLPHGLKKKWLNGEITLTEAFERAPARSATRADGGEDGYEPASPVTAGTNSNRRGSSNIEHKVESFKLVFPSPTLLKIVELADEVAAELNLLAELKPPNKEDAEGF